MVVMNRPSLEKFAKMVKPGGVILVNSSLIPITSGRNDVDELRVPVMDIATNVGDVRSANIVALGAFVARSKIIDFELIRQMVRKEFGKKEKSLKINLAALEEGRKAASV